MNPAARSLLKMFRPRSVAVVGASRSKTSVGGAVFHNLLEGGFQGAVYPVNPHGDHVQSVRAYRTLDELPEIPDLVVVSVPRKDVLEVVRQAAEMGVPAATVLTAGFGETGPEGRASELQLRELARKSGMRLLGPNCLGLQNTDPAVALNATFATSFGPPGNIAFASQSGAVGLAALDYASELGIGISAFASLGNKADLSGNDLLELFEEDPRTRTVLLYLESFGNPQKFRKIASRVGRRKPIALVKAGRSSAGARAAGSHTGSMSGPDAAIDALCEQTGVIRADTLEELFDVATVLGNAPLPGGRRVAVVTNAGGPGILAADALEARGLIVPSLSPETEGSLRAVLPTACSVQNPVDVLADAEPRTYGLALQLAMADPSIDAVIAVYVPPITGDAVAIAKEIARGAVGAKKPVLSCFLGTFGVAEAKAVLREHHVPLFRFPEGCAKALSLATQYAEWRDRLQETPEEPLPAPAPALKALEAARARLGDAGGWLSADECTAFAEAWKLEMVPQLRCEPTLDALFATSAKLGFPVVVKAEVPQLVHKTEAGAVALNLRTNEQLKAAFRKMAELEPTALLVQPFLEGGAEWLVGAVRDPVHGPLVTAGAGGVDTELRKDVHQRLAPLTDTDVKALVSRPRVGRALGGWRGGPAMDVVALERFIRQLGRAAVAHPEIGELEANPVKVLPAGRGAVAVDLRIHLLPKKTA